jgi:hypothetical protein
MAAGLTDHIWTLREVLLFRVPPWPQTAEVCARIVVGSCKQRKGPCGGDVRPHSLLRGCKHRSWGYRSAKIALPSVTGRFCDDRRTALVDLSAGYRYTTGKGDEMGMEESEELVNGKKLSSNWLRVLQIGLNFCSLKENLMQ